MFFFLAEFDFFLLGSRLDLIQTKIINAKKNLEEIIDTVQFGRMRDSWD